MVGASGGCFRHVYWHALIQTYRLGFQLALKFGAAYENRPNNPDGDADIRNNEVGANIGVAYREGRLHSFQVWLTLWIACRVGRYRLGDGKMRIERYKNCHNCTS